MIRWMSFPCFPSIRLLSPAGWTAARRCYVWCRFNDEYGDDVADGLELRVDSGFGNVHCLYYIGGNCQISQFDSSSKERQGHISKARFKGNDKQTKKNLW